MPLKEGQREGVRVASSLVAFLPRGRRGVLRVPVIGPLSCCYVRSGGGGVGVGGGGGRGIILQRRPLLGLRFLDDRRDAGGTFCRGPFM